MKLQVLLWLMMVFYQRAIKRNAAMRDYLVDVDSTIQFATQVGRVKRYFRFHQQSLVSRAEQADEADMTICFRNAKEGFTLLWAMATGKDKNVFMRAIQEKQLVVEGDYQLLIWLQKSVRYLR